MGIAVKERYFLKNPQIMGQHGIKYVLIVIVTVPVHQVAAGIKYPVTVIPGKGIMRHLFHLKQLFQA
ncbi:hypothetical protein D9M69_591010 [compost metagenome]